MYTKDKNQRITLRLNEEQFQFVKTVSDTLGVSPSDYLRMIVNLSMVGAKKASEADSITSDKEGLRRENEQTNCDHIVQ